jgi:hypothetical protein
MYRMFRIFCATAWELEGERRAFYDVIGEFNESHAMQQGVLYIPVSLTNTPDKRPYQHTVEENIRDARYYILAAEDWGPRERNFERDHQLAVACVRDPSLPMQQAVSLIRTQPDGSPSPLASTLEAAGMPGTSFTGMNEFRDILRRLLCGWLSADVEKGKAAGATT